MPRITAAGLIVLALGCQPEPRERDCATVREILEPPPAPPRRYYDAKAEPVPPLSPLERLRTTPWQSDEVRAAVKAVLDDDGWQFYTPYRVENAPPGAADRLAELCGLQRHTVIVEK